MSQYIPYYHNSEGFEVSGHAGFNITSHSTCFEGVQSTYMGPEKWWWWQLRSRGRASCSGILGSPQGQEHLQCTLALQGQAMPRHEGTKSQIMYVYICIYIYTPAVAFGTLCHHIWLLGPSAKMIGHQTSSTRGAPPSGYVASRVSRVREPTAAPRSQQCARSHLSCPCEVSHPSLEV